MTRVTVSPSRVTLSGSMPEIRAALRDAVQRGETMVQYIDRLNREALIAASHNAEAK